MTEWSDYGFGKQREMFPKVFPFFFSFFFFYIFIPSFEDGVVIHSGFVSGSP
jgi:hypothetical protein